MLRLLVLFSLPIGVFAQAAFTIDQVMSAPFASSLVASPTGAKLAWLLDEQGRHNVWVAEAPLFQAHKVTDFNSDDGQEIGDLTWSKDGQSLFFTRGGELENGGENPNPGLLPARPDQSIWTVQLNGAPSHKLTEGRSPAVSPAGDLVTFIRGGQLFTMTLSGQSVKEAVREAGSVTGLRWSPNGKSLAFTNTRKDHSFVGLYAPEQQTVRYLDPSTDLDSEPVWSPDGRRLAFLRIPSDTRGSLHAPERTAEPWSIRVANAGETRSKQVFRASPGMGSAFHGIVSDDQLHWVGDGIVFPYEKTGWCHLFRVNLDINGAAVELTPGEGEVEHVEQAANGGTLFYSSNIGDIDRRHLWKNDGSSSATPKQITSGQAIEWNPAPLADGSGLGYLASGYNSRAHAVVQAGNNRPAILAAETIPSGFPATQLVRPEPVAITAADGLVLHGQLFIPQSPGPHPALAFFHGGSRRQMLLGFHYMAYYSNAYAMNQYLASRGYVVLSVNYRSGIGYGLNFREALQYGPGGGSEFNDVIGAGLYLKSRPDVDGKRIGVWGGSYGGYLTALALARASDLFHAGVDFHGVHDWSSFLADSVHSGDPAQQQAFHEAARLAFDSSPLASIRTWRSPVLLIHGDDDRNVPFSQTVVLADALRKQQVPFEELIFPNEIHDFLLHRHWLEAYKATADFFDRKLAHPGG